MRLLVILCLAVALLPATAQEEGLFAEFKTSMGTMRAQLDHERVPLTVSHFVGLVEGTQATIDFTKGGIGRGAYFDGQIFHRVIENFMIQGGSPDGRGDGGPGYSFQDEFHPELTHEAFVLSMANSGPSSNGSQFFITVAPQPHLNNLHSVFGKLTEGMDVATAISKVATNPVDRPLEDVMLESVTIERIGEAAEQFDATVEELPKPQHPKVDWRIENGRYFLDLAYHENSDYQLFTSEDLVTWTADRIGIFGGEPPDLPLDVTDVVEGRSESFFRVVEVRYPVVVFPPPNVVGKRLDTTIKVFGSNPTTDTPLAYEFATPTTGRVNLLNREWLNFQTYLYRIESPTRATLVVPSDLIVPFDLPQFRLDFTSATTGTFFATLPTASPPTSIRGVFTLNDL